MPKSKKKKSNKKRYHAEPGLSIRKAWRRFRRALAAALSDLDNDEFLIISSKESEHFVQFFAQGGLGIRAEAQSNNFILEKRLRLKKKARRHLVKMGWMKPTYVLSRGVTEPSDGSCNYYVDADHPVSYVTLAAMAVDSLREVYGVRFPGDLEYHSFAKGGNSIRFPLLRIQRKSEEGALGEGSTSADDDLEDDTEHCCFE